MPLRTLSNFILLPELNLLSIRVFKNKQGFYRCEKVSGFEVCPRCATPSNTIYDHREVEVKDAPIRGKSVYLKIKKRRFFCKKCKNPFTEPVPGIKKGKRCTDRFERELLHACENYQSLSRVRKVFKCSTAYVYKALYHQLELKRRMNLYPWPKTIGIDEHKFKRNKQLSIAEFASIIVDYNNKRVMELVEGKTAAGLANDLAYIPERGNVKNVVLDLCDPFKKFVTEFFPNAQITADKFHVLRLLHPAINRERKNITGDRRSLPVRKLLLRNGKNIDWSRKHLLNDWLKQYPVLNEIYHYKEALHGLYRIRGYNRASRALTALTDRMAHSAIKEIKTLRRTLIKWKTQILNYFKFGITNGRTEGYNNKCKLVKKNAYGYKSFKNYRLRVLSACR